MPDVFVPESLRQEHFHGPADKFHGLESEERRNLPVGKKDDPRSVDDHHGIGRRFEDTGKQFGGKHGPRSWLFTLDCGVVGPQHSAGKAGVGSLRDAAAWMGCNNCFMKRRILIIDAHPDSRPERYLHALAGAYAEGALSAGHEVRRLALAGLKFPLLRTNDEFQAAAASRTIQDAQDSLLWAEHVVILFPLWLGAMPALLKGFLEQVLRPGFAYALGARAGLPRKLLKGRSARIVVTMGMPALFYRLFYRAHSVRSLERNILAFCGIGPIRTSLVGTVDGMSPKDRAVWLGKLKTLGRRAR